GFGSPCPWPVAAVGRLLVFGCGLVGSSHATILWSCACHTFPSPRPKALGASADHRGGCLVSGDVFIGGAPVLVSPRAAVGGVDREQADPTAVGLGAQPVAKHRGWQTGHRLSEAFSAPAATHRLAPGAAGVGEVEVLDGDRGDAIPAGVVDEAGDRVAHVGIAARGGAGEV